jgi:hypothetical protein
MKLNTVNVIVLKHDNLDSIMSFSDDLEGNKEAEALFLKLVKLNDEGLDEETLDDILNDGIYESYDGQYIISHSGMSDE